MPFLITQLFKIFQFNSSLECIWHFITKMTAHHNVDLFLHPTVKPFISCHVPSINYPTCVTPTKKTLQTSKPWTKTSDIYVFNSSDSINNVPLSFPQNFTSQISVQWPPHTGKVCITSTPHIIELFHHLLLFFKNGALFPFLHCWSGTSTLDGI